MEDDPTDSELQRRDLKEGDLKQLDEMKLRSYIYV